MCECLPACVHCLHLTGVKRGQMRASDPLKLQLQIVVMRVTGIELRSSGRAVDALKY